MYQVAFQNNILCTMALSRQNFFIHPDSQSLRALLHTWDSALPTTPKTADSKSPFLLSVQIANEDPPAAVLRTDDIRATGL